MQQFSEKDHYYMQQALECARAVKGTTLPNPAVGAIIVKNGRIVGRGATSRCGGPHAERHALDDAGAAAHGAVLYVTLEPCCHYGRTPPCTDALIAAGISRVVVALRDPNPRVAGKGMAQLRRHGVEVACGCLRKEAALLNEDFIFAITHNRAFITLKLALSLDGYIADADGHSKWITSPAQRKEVHALRGMHAAVAVGRGTLEADDPHLDVRYGRRCRPTRIVFTSTDKLSPTSYFFTHAHQTRSVVVVRGDGDQTIMIDTASGVEYWYTGESDPHASMEVFSRMAFAAEITSVFVEGGAIIAATLLEAKLVNRIHLFYGNKILGGGKPGLLLGRGLPIDKCITLQETSVRSIDGGVCITGIPAQMLLSTPAVRGK